MPLLNSRDYLHISLPSFVMLKYTLKIIKRANFHRKGP
jgi:hypothetical protein